MRPFYRKYEPVTVKVKQIPHFVVKWLKGTRCSGVGANVQDANAGIWGEKASASLQSDKRSLPGRGSPSRPVRASRGLKGVGTGRTTRGRGSPRVAASERAVSRMIASVTVCNRVLRSPCALITYTL